ncbi:MAG: 4-hydroxy-tetrahydrodipicolinate synthase, partial [Sphaerochaeta sp.]
SIDLGALKALLQFQLENGIHGLVPVGTTGESPTLDAREKELIIQTTVEAAKGKVPVIAGTGCNNTKAAIEATKRAKELGADFTLQVAPYYSKPTEEGLYRHFSSLAEQGGLPIVLYNVPGRSAINIPPSLIIRLAEEGSIVAVKEASGSMAGILAILNKRPKDFSVLSGDDALTLPVVASGGQGIISVASNMFPKEMVELYEALKQENKTEALRIHNQLYPFFVNQFMESNPIPIKTYMAEHGMCQEIFRLPLCTMKRENRISLLTTFD